MQEFTPWSPSSPGEGIAPGTGNISGVFITNLGLQTHPEGVDVDASVHVFLLLVFIPDKTLHSSAAAG